MENVTISECFKALRCGTGSIDELKKLGIKINKKILREGENHGSVDIRTSKNPSKCMVRS